MDSFEFQIDQVLVGPRNPPIPVGLTFRIIAGFLNVGAGGAKRC